MRHQSKIWNNFILSATIFTAAFGFTACDKEESSANLSNEEVALVVEGALVSETQGISKEVNDAVFITQEYAQKTSNNERCGQAFDSTVTRSINEARVTANYMATWNWAVNCNNLRVPTSLDFGMTTTGEYETQRMISDDNAASEWTISNLFTGASYTFTGSYSREGSQTAKVRDQNSFNSDLDVIITSLNVNKSTLRIDSGTATFKLVGSGTEGNRFSYEGSIVFNGNGAATITINGETFEIQL